MRSEAFSNWLTNPHRPCLLMGVLNVTPDSFSDGGRFLDRQAAIDQAYRMAAEGAAIIDIGGESTRPGAESVSAQDQIGRIVPVIKAIAGSIDALISVDTTRAAVAAAALDAGADIVNDISAGRDDPDLLPLVARRGVPVVLMHMLGTPRTMQQSPHYEDVVREVRDFLGERIAAAGDAGISQQNILIDPGIGFGKTTAHNLALLRHLDQLVALGRPVLVGVSRKRFLGEITGKTDPTDRLIGTAAAVAWSITNGAAITRVHDVEPMRQVRDVLAAILTCDEDGVMSDE